MESKVNAEVFRGFEKQLSLTYAILEEKYSAKRHEINTCLRREYTNPYYRDVTKWDKIYFTNREFGYCVGTTVVTIHAERASSHLSRTFSYSETFFLTLSQLNVYPSFRLTLREFQRNKHLFAALH